MRSAPPRRWHISAVARLFVLTLAPPLVWASGCASTTQQNPRENLTDSLSDYHRHLIWGRYAEAAGYLPEGERTDFVEAFEEEGDDLQFTEYELGQIDLDSEDQATVMVTLKWYREPEYVIRETRVREHWRHDEESDYWWLTARDDPEAPPTAEVIGESEPSEVGAP